MNMAAGLLSAGPNDGSSGAASLFVCPDCRGPLRWGRDRVACTPCGTRYRRIGHRVDFAGATPPETEDSAFQQERMFGRSLRGRLYDLGQRLITSEYAPVDRRKAFLAAIPAGAVVVELGSGNRRLRADFINIDLFLFPNVDAASDIVRVPLPDGCADVVILDSVIEHVPEPAAVVAEAHRILKPGGRLLCLNPFLFPYHGYPAHYCNFTADGVRHLLRAFGAVEVEPYYGPASALVNITAEYVALGLAGTRRTPYLVVRALVLAAIGWFRFLDRWLMRRPHAHRLAGMLCSVATK